MEVKNITLRQATWAFVAVITLEASILGVYFGIRNSIDRLVSDKVLLEARMQKLEDRQDRTEETQRNVESRTRTLEIQMQDTYSDRLQKKYDHQNP